MKGKVTLFKCKGGLESGEYGDGKGFVEGKDIWNFGIMWHDLELDFGVADVVEVKKGTEL